MGDLDCAIKNVAGGIDACMAKYCTPVSNCAFVSVSNKDGTGECNPHSASKCNFDKLNQQDSYYTMKKPGIQTNYRHNPPTHN